MEPSLPNHSLKIVKASSKTKIKENISNENSLKNGNKNRINKYKILRNRNAQKKKKNIYLYLLTFYF